MRRLSLAEAVGLARAIGYGGSVASHLFEEPAHRLERAEPDYGVSQHGRLVPSREVQSDQGLVCGEQSASIAGDAGHEPYYPWPKVLKASRATRRKKGGIVLPGGDVRASGEAEVPITAQSELLPPLVDALREAQRRDPFVRDEKWTE